MTNERLFEVLDELSSVLEEGLEESKSCVGLTHEDSERIRSLSAKVSYALGIIDFYKDTVEEVQV